MDQVLLLLSKYNMFVFYYYKNVQKLGTNIPDWIGVNWMILVLDKMQVVMDNVQVAMGKVSILINSCFNTPSSSNSIFIIYYLWLFLLLFWYVYVFILLWYLIFVGLDALVDLYLLDFVVYDRFGLLDGLDCWMVWIAGWFGLIVWFIGWFICICGCIWWLCL